MGLHLNLCPGLCRCWEGASLASLELGGGGMGWGDKGVTSFTHRISLTLHPFLLPGRCLSFPNPDTILAHCFQNMPAAFLELRAARKKRGYTKEEADCIFLTLTWEHAPEDPEMAGPACY